MQEHCTVVKQGRWLFHHSPLPTMADAELARTWHMCNVRTLLSLGLHLIAQVLTGCGPAIGPREPLQGEELAKKLYFLQNAEGAGLAPFDCWLALRGLKTMSLRMERSAENCAKLAAYLSTHPLVKKVGHRPGLRLA
eukprot:363940-Chlamydomonas_euryale.AAC.13